jgi:hypothetical protein
MFGEIASGWRDAVAAKDREHLSWIIGRLVREISATPIAKGAGRRKARIKVEVVFNFDASASFRPDIAYASPHVSDGLKTPPFELSEALQIGWAATRG